MSNTTASELAKRISANVDAFYASTITIETFRAESIRLWDAIRAAGAESGVLAIQRNEEAAS